MITLLMNASTLEAASRRAVDLNRELITAGIGNLAAGLGGGLPGHHSVSAGLLPHYLGTQSRLVGLVSAAVCGATLAVGGPLLGFVPKLLIGLVLFYLALDLTIDLAVDRWPLVSRGERLVMLAVFATLVAVGFVEGIVLGIVAGLAVFAVNYARTGVVRAQGSGLAYASNVVRPPAQVSALEEVAEAIHVVRLQGFLFFGTAHRLLDEIGTQLAAARAVPLRFLVLDFARVTGADSSAIASFARLLDEAESRGFQILLAAVPPPVRALIDVVGRGVDLKLFADLDHCLEHAENELLAKAVPGGGPDGHEAAGDLAEVLADPMLRRRLLTYARPVTWRPGQTVIVQGELSNAMYFIERGRLTARLKLSQGGTVRVTTLLPGTVVGEIGCYLDLPRTLTLIAESTVTAWAIDREALERMRQKEPDLAADFHYRMVRLASSRLAALTRYLEHHDR
jgi:SulP family sulfate permease